MPNAESALSIATWDESGQLVQPDVVDAGVSGWNGYRYWMTVTNYPGGETYAETLSLYASNDKTTWVVPAGGTNPFFTQIEGDSYSDSDSILVDGVMHLFYDYRPAGLPVVDYVLHRTSTNGVDWSAADTIFTGGKNEHQGLGAVYNNGLWMMWFHDEIANLTRNTFYLVTAISPTGPWSNPVECYVDNWARWSHIDVSYDSDIYYALMYSDDGVLYFAMSNDGVHWSRKLAPIISPSAPGGWDDFGMYRSSLAKAGDVFDVWYTGRADALDWKIGYTQLSFTALPEITSIIG